MVDRRFSNKFGTGKLVKM